jgi:hypothetical protein
MSYYSVIIKTMNKELSQLEETKKTNPFKVPEGYFEDLTGRVMNQLPDKFESQPKVVSLWQRMQVWVYMAAMFAGIALMVKLFTLFSQSSKTNLNLTSSAEIDDFYQYYEDQVANKVYHETFYLDDLNNFSDDLE